MAERLSVEKASLWSKALKRRFFMKCTSASLIFPFSDNKRDVPRPINLCWNTEMKKAAYLSSKMCSFLVDMRFGLANLTRAITDHYGDDYRFVPKLCSEFLAGIIDKLVIEFVFHQVDGASTEATTHNA